MAYRVNSNQSVRIRNLETEVSKLLGENLELKEQAIKLQEGLDKHPTPVSWKEVKVLKQRLETKIRDFSGLLQELDDVHQRQGGQGKAKQNSYNTTSPGQLARQKPIRAKLAFIDAQAEDRLPPISEERRSSQAFDT